MLKQRKGSHVGVVLSFVVFVTFLIFIFTTLQPLTKDTQKRDILIDYLKEKITEEISADLIKITISGVGTTKPVLKVDAPKGVCFDEYNIMGKTGDGQNLLGKVDGCNSYIEKPFNPSLIYIYLSEENISTGKLSSISSFQEVDISLYQDKNYIFESRIISFIKRYESEYEVLKKELEIPQGNEFGFSFKNFEGDVLKTSEQDVQIDTFVDQIPVEYVNQSGDISGGFVTFKIW